jgi:hypothetical protein
MSFSGSGRGRFNGSSLGDTPPAAPGEPSAAESALRTSAAMARTTKRPGYMLTEHLARRHR